MNTLWLQRSTEPRNIDDIQNKQVIMMGRSISDGDAGEWYAICIYDEIKKIFKFRSLLRWNNKPWSYKEQKMKQSIDKEYWIDYSNMDCLNEWWIELKERILKIK